ncbi:polysaccharide biosynthesis PFTS motif protein [Kiloniella antarctica]|uniref:Polysaccharide biosynthesis PFTS motif protein n=1 Tax=Kiloniella antarctica TaxID=1550907 RepID=A0ABW5BPT8_9PROT
MYFPSIYQLKNKIARRVFIRRLKQARAHRRLDTDSVVRKRYYDFIRFLSAVSIRPLGIPVSAAAGIVPRSYRANLDLLIRQRLLHRNLYVHFFPQIMASAADQNHPAIIPFPHEWRSCLQQKGMNVQALQSTLYFIWGQVLEWISGVRCTLRLLLDSWRQPEVPEGNYSLLVDFPSAAVCNEKSAAAGMKCFSTWYRNNSVRGESTNTVWIQVTDSHPTSLGDDQLVVHNYFPRLKNWGDRMIFLGKALGIIILTTGRWLKGSWWAPYILTDAVRLAYCRTLGRQGMASKYVFNNSGWFIRPLWTHFSEDLGADIVIFFYSANVHPLEYIDEESAPVMPGYQLMNWPQYLVWGQPQAQFISNNCYNQNSIVKIVGPVPFTDIDTVIPVLPDNAIAVFDVTAQRTVSLSDRGIIADYYGEDLVIAFVEQAYEAIKASGGTMVFKQKRDLPSISSKKYLIFLEWLSGLPDVIMINPNVSAFRIIEHVTSVISIPFTSTGLIARSNMKFSAYFDPTMNLKKDNPGADNVPVLSGQEELISWLDSISSKDKKAT